MGVCPLSPQVRVIKNHNETLKKLLKNQLKDLKIYGFNTPLLKAINQIPNRYLYTEGILQDIDKLNYLGNQSTLKSDKQVSVIQNIDDEIKNSCLILQNQADNQIGSSPGFQGNFTFMEATHSFQNNMSRNQSLVAQMNIIYGREIKKQEYSQSLKLFLKWVQFFNEHSFGGFLKPIYKAFCTSLYQLSKEQFDTVIDEVGIFVQYMVKIYTQIYHLKDLNESAHGKLFKNQNVYNLIMSFMFRKTKIKQFVRLMIISNNQQKIKYFQHKLRIYHKKCIAFFGVDKKFILMKDKQKQEEQKQPQQCSQFYSGSLRLTAELASTNATITPISKLKIIVAISKQIMRQINAHYKEISKQAPQMDPDNLTSIIMYLIAKTNNKNIYQQLRMVEYFTTTNAMNCISGYYLNMFIASIDSILQL